MKPTSEYVDDTQMPAVSVLLPAHNAVRCLREALDSVHGQSFVDFELLVFDDGSTDAALAVMKNGAARYRRVQIYSCENRSLISTPNELFASARSRFIARMDADDS